MSWLAAPVLFEDIKRVPVFKVLQCHEAIIEAYAEVAGEFPCPDDVAGGTQPIILHRGLIDRIYRPEGFPWIEPRRGQPVREDSIASDHRFQPGQISEMEECEPETWFGEHSARSVEVLSEQLHAQQNGWATVLLHAELTEHD